MRTVFNNFSPIEHEDAVKMDNSREAVSDDECGFPFNSIKHSFLDVLLRFTIKSRCCLVKDDDRCFCDERSCNCDTLSLSSREFDTSFSDQSLISFWELRYKRIAVSDLAVFMK